MKYIYDKLFDHPSIKFIISFGGSLLTFLLGGFGTLLSSFVTLLVMDFVTGILKSWQKGILSSYLGRKGGRKIIAYTLIIIFANLLDQAGITGIRSFTILWASVTEGISIIENLDELGVPIPDPIRDKLLQTKEKKFG